MTSDFDVPAVDARNSIQSLLRSPARILGATDTDLLEAYERNTEKRHDVYDSFVLALVRAHQADFLVTADRDFATLCDGEDVAYRNPIPEGKLATLSKVGG